MNQTFKRLIVSFVIAKGVYGKNKGVLGWQKQRNPTKTQIYRTSSFRARNYDLRLKYCSNSFSIDKPYGLYVFR